MEEIKVVAFYILTDSSFENEFFDTITSDNYIDPSCSSGRQSRTYHVLWKYKNIPEQYRYFYNPNTGGYQPAQYCPVSEKWYEEEKKIHEIEINFKNEKDKDSSINQINNLFIQVELWKK